MRALRVLGTHAARDAVVESIDRFIDHPELLPAALGCLLSLPLEQHGERIFRFLGPQWPRSVRLRAVRILAECGSQYVLERLAGRIIEPFTTIRVVGFRALARVGYLDMLRVIKDQSLTECESPDEEKAIWEYLKQIAGIAANAPNSGYWLGIIESVLLSHLDRGKPLSQETVGVACTLSRSRKVQAILERWAFDESLQGEIRAAAIAGLRLTKATPMIVRLRGLLDQSLTQKAACSVAQACAEKLAFTKPEELLHLDYPVIEMALWKMSLETGELVFSDHVAPAFSGDATEDRCLKVMPDPLSLGHQRRFCRLAERTSSHYGINGRCARWFDR